MSRKRRKTRSRQQRQRIHARTRQTYAQAIGRYFEALYRSQAGCTWSLPGWERGPLATHNRWLP